MRQQGQQAFGLAGAGGGDAQIGPVKGGCAGDAAQQVRRQVAIQRDGPAPGRIGTPQPPVDQRRQDRIVARFQRMRIGDRGNQPVRILDRHVTIRRQVGQMGEIGIDPQRAHGLEQGAPFGIVADRGQNGRAHAETRQRHRDVHGHAPRQAGDMARHVATTAQGPPGASDDVPQDRSDAKNVRGCHVLRKVTIRARSAAWSGSRPRASSP